MRYTSALDFDQMREAAVEVERRSRPRGVPGVERLEPRAIDGPAGPEQHIGHRAHEIQALPLDEPQNRARQRRGGLDREAQDPLQVYPARRPGQATLVPSRRLLV